MVPKLGWREIGPNTKFRQIIVRFLDHSSATKNLIKRNYIVVLFSFLVEDDAFRPETYENQNTYCLPEILFSPNSAFDPIYQYSVGQVNRFGVHPDNLIDVIKRNWLRNKKFSFS